MGKNIVSKYDSRSIQIDTYGDGDACKNLMIGPLATDNGEGGMSVGLDSFMDSPVVVTVRNSEVGNLSREVASLRAEVRHVSAVMEELVTALGASDRLPTTIGEHESMKQICDIETAKAAILQLLEIDEVFSYSDILDKLNIDLELVVAACEALEREEKIGQRRPAA